MSILCTLQESPDSKVITLYKKRITDKSYPAMKEAYQDIKKGSFVFLTDHAGGYQSLNEDFSIDEACNIRELEIDYARQRQGTIIPKHSSYKRIIDFQ